MIDTACMAAPGWRYFKSDEIREALMWAGRGGTSVFEPSVPFHNLPSRGSWRATFRLSMRRRANWGSVPSSSKPSLTFQS
jgi:hypothetical protein